MESKAEEKVKNIVSGVFDITFSIVYVIFMMSSLSLLLDATEWRRITFSEYFSQQFSDSKLWFNLWILSLFYVPMRLLMRGEFWRIIFKKYSN